MFKTEVFTPYVVSEQTSLHDDKIGVQFQYYSLWKGTIRDRGTPGPISSFSMPVNFDMHHSLLLTYHVLPT